MTSIIFTIFSISFFTAQDDDEDTESSPEKKPSKKPISSKSDRDKKAKEKGGDKKKEKEKEKEKGKTGSEICFEKRSERHFPYVYLLVVKYSTRH